MKKDALSDQQIEILLNACENDTERFYLTILIFTGMRVDEFAHMKRYWYDKKNNIINVPRREGSWKPKTKAGIRAIPIVEPRAKFVLDKFFEKNLEVGRHRASIWRVVKKVASRTKISHKVYPHALRSTFATLLSFKGMSEGTIATVLGWSSILTAREYVKLSGQRAKVEMESKW